MKKIISLTSLLAFSVIIAPALSYAQVIKQNYITTPVSLSLFLEQVGKGNLGYAATNLDADIAEAELEASKIFPDPEITGSYTDNQDRKLAMGLSYGGGLSYQLNLGNKRGAGIQLARSKSELASLALDAFFQNLRAEAAIYYFNAVRNNYLNKLQKEIYEEARKLAAADSLRLLAGEANRLDAMQSSIEAKTVMGNLYQADADLENALISLSVLQGRQIKDTLSFPADDFPSTGRAFTLQDLISSALKNRSDLLAAIKNRELSDRSLAVLKAERAPDIVLEAGFYHNTESKNGIAPAPAYNSVSAGIGLPLKFSSLNRGEIKAAEYSVRQSEIKGRETELQIISEVMSAYSNYVSQLQKVSLYKTGIIDDAEKIVKGRIISYQKGETGLVEVLNAQRSYAELRMNHIEALFDYTVALINLEKASGIWDLNQ